MGAGWGESCTDEALLLCSKVMLALEFAESGLFGDA